MSVNTSRKWAWLVLAAAVLSAGTRASETKSGDYEIKVSVFNDAHISEGKLLRAEKVAAEPFAQAGIRIDWMNCGRPTETTEEQAACSEAAFPNHLEVRLRQRSLNLAESTLGLSYVGEDGIGCHADVFYAGIPPVEQEVHLSSGTILGLAIAHELGHLLLGTKSHSDSGIMRAVWQKPELSGARKGALRFSDAQALRMKARLASGLRPVEPHGSTLSR